jgi:hypothetical protein
MVKKLAIFVEGETEQIFVKKLISELANKGSVCYEIQRQHEGVLSLVKMIDESCGNPEIHVLIANCRHDGQVKTQIIDRYKYLVKAGYSLVIGLRDVYPMSHSEIPKLQQYLYTRVSQSPVPVEFILAIMEIEAWFLEETTHFARVHPALTKEVIVESGFNPDHERAESFPNPAEILNQIYGSVGLAYKKRENQVNRTVDALSFENIYLEVRGLSPSMNKLLEALEGEIF